MTNQHTTVKLCGDYNYKNKLLSSLWVNYDDDQYRSNKLRSTDEWMIEFKKRTLIIKSHFPNAWFDMSEYAYKLNDVFSELDSIIIEIQQGGSCNCFKNQKVDKTFIMLRNEDGTGITYFRMLKALCDSGFHPLCDHRCLEGFTENTEYKFTPRFGS
jgi:hypothetical protein